MEYSYTPLNGNEIRLFKVTARDDDAVMGQLETFSFTDTSAFPSPPPFTALSYTWGAPTYAYDIPVDGLKLPILDSVNTFVRHELPKHESTWWWIDSICINQKDDEEKGSQIGLMGQIFRSAQLTYVWLGEEADDSTDAIAFLDWMSGLRIEYGGDLPDKTIEELQMDNGPHSRDWTAVKHLFRRPWWTRAWTLQEFVVSQQVWFHCGHASICGDDLQLALDTIYDCGVYFNTTAQWNRFRMLQWYTRGIETDTTTPVRLSLVATLAYVGDHRATDPRDRIYSLSDIVNDIELAGVPDYSQPVELLYTRVVTAFVEKYRNLDIICFVTTFHQSDNNQYNSLPSWVPDWSVTTFPLVVPLMVSQGSGLGIGNLRPLHRQKSTAVYSASGSSRSNPVFSVDHKQMRCSGLVLGVIDGLAGLPSVEWKGSTVLGYELIQPLSSKHIDPEKEQKRKRGASSSTDAFNIMASIMRCLVLDRHDHYLNHCAPRLNFMEQSQALLSLARGTAPALYVAFQAWYAANKAPRILGQDLGTLTAKLLEEELVDDSIPLKSGRRSFYSRFHDTTVKMARRFVVLDNGRFGTAPMRARQGDSVCILFGCSVPVVLRQQNDEQTYTVIGERYIDNCMNGEASSNEENIVFTIV
jgi:hypothetical protein